MYAKAREAEDVFPAVPHISAPSFTTGMLQSANEVGPFEVLPQHSRMCCRAGKMLSVANCNVVPPAWPRRGWCA